MFIYRKKIFGNFNGILYLCGMKKYLLLFVFVSLLLSSCKTSGYGCKGNESWGHMVKRINNGY